MIKLLPLLLVFITACASVELAPIKSKKIQRLSYTDKSNKPQFYILNYRPKRVGRTIASIGIEDEGISNKQAYFLALYQQYQTINQVVGKESKKLNCPQFHNELLEYERLIHINHKQYSLKQNYQKVLSNEKYLAGYPVMALPYQGNGDVYSYYKGHQGTPLDRVVYQAVETYNKKNWDEIQTLCNQGVSGNYYIYENLVSYYGSDESFHQGKNALSSVLKIPVFANMLVLDSLKRPESHGQNVFDDTILAKGHLEWFKNYLYELRKIRKNGEKYSNKRRLLHEAPIHYSNAFFTNELRPTGTTRRRERTK
jgi:hypothetical protein